MEPTTKAAGHKARPTITTTAPTTAPGARTVPRRYDNRAERARRHARRELDSLVVRLYGLDLPVEVEPYDGDYWYDTWMSRGWAERDYRGRELLAAGWAA